MEVNLNNFGQAKPLSEESIFRLCKC